MPGMARTPPGTATTSSTSRRTPPPPGRSWHEQWATPHPHNKAFANAVTFVLDPNGTNGLRYFAVRSKDHHAAVAAAGTDAALQQALLDGLNYATVHLYATGIRDQYAVKARLASWIAAVNGFLAGPAPAWLSTTTQALAWHISGALGQVKLPPL